MNPSASQPTRPPAEPEAEARLLEQLRRGDEQAYERFVRANAGRMLATARRVVRNEEDAHDVVQEAFLAAFRALPDFAGQARLSTWLHRITVNAALMKLRSQRRRPELLLEDLSPEHGETPHVAPEQEPPFPAPDESLRRRDRHRTVRAGLARLPADYRTAIELRDLEERDTEETARLLGTTPGAVKTRLHRARQALRTLLEPELQADPVG
jgi:RNA polymerase sigma-70 factor (ECF subfamily)